MIDPITGAKLWLMFKPIKRWKNRRARKEAEQMAEEGIIVQPQEFTDAQVEAEVKEFVVRKAKGAVRSSTIGVAALIVAIGGWMQANPAAVSALVPDGFEGVALAGIGLLVAIARMRTAGK